MSQVKFFPLSNDFTTRNYLSAVAFCAAGLVIAGIASLYDSRLFNGVALWWKPAKFWLSIGLHFFTLALYMQLVCEKRRGGIIMAGTAFVTVAMGVFENVYISLQAARGRASHYNFETAAEGLAYAMMGVGAVILVLAPLVISTLLVLQRDGDRSGLKLGVIIGSMATFVLTLGFGGYMSMHGSHYFGPIYATDAGGLPLVGWSTSQPDMRPAHFVASHILQVAPLVGWSLDIFKPTLSRAAVWGVTVFMSLVASFVFFTAVSGTAPLGFLA